MFLLVIGGTGHIGSFLVPRLVEAGHRVVCLSRGARSPYVPHDAWREVEHVTIDRREDEARGHFGETIVALKPESVIDLTCYTLESAVQLCDALSHRGIHLVHCGTIWVHGPSVTVPTTEEEPRRAFGDYGCRKAAIERYLTDQSRLGRVPVTTLHPGHLVGPGWAPINPAGNFNLEVFDDLAHGRPVRLPNFGMETLHHVHADDVAQAFVQAVEHAPAAIGESFHVVSPGAITCRGYAERMAEWFGVAPQLEFVPYSEWQRDVPERDAAVTLDHLQHSPSCSIEKARTRLGYTPRYTSLAAIQESVTWLIDQGRLRSRGREMTR